MADDAEILERRLRKRHPVGSGPAGCDGVDAQWEVVVLGVHARAPDQTNQPVLQSNVVRCVESLVRGARGCEDDAPPSWRLLRRHVVRCECHLVRQCDEVDLEGEFQWLLELAVGALSEAQEVLGRVDAGVGEEDADAPMLGVHLVEEGA